MKKLVIIVVIAILTLTSCIKAEDITIESIDDVEIISSSKLEVTVTAGNRSKKDINLLKARIVIQKEGYELAQLLIDQQVTLPKQFDGQIVIPIRIKLTDLLGLVTIARDLSSSDNLDELTAHGEATIKVGRVQRNININTMPLSELLKKFEGNIEEIKLPI